MANTFYNLGYNLANEFSLKLNELCINGHDYPIASFEQDIINITSWWKQAETTTIEANFHINRVEIMEDCSLAIRDELFLTLFTYCPGSKLQHHGTTKLISDDELDVEIRIPPFELAEEVDLHGLVTVRLDANNVRRVGAPIFTNSRLLSKKWKIALSGSRTQANVVCLDFSKNPRLSQAMWNIKIDDGYDMDTWLTTQHSKALRIEVNKLYEDYVDQTQFKILLMTDVVMLSLSGAILDDEKLAFLQNNEIADGSWAKFVKTMYLSIFSVGELQVKQKWIDGQSEIRARVQHQMSENLGLN